MRIRLLRSATLRFAIVITAVFFTITLASGYFAKQALVSSLASQALFRAVSTADELVDEHVREGDTGLYESIVPRLHGGERRLRYGLVSKDGELLLGDGEIRNFIRPADGASARLADRAGVPPYAALVSRRLSDDVMLYVVDELDAIGDVERTLGSALRNVMLLTALLGVVAAFCLSRYLLWQMSSITRTAQAIIAGDLTRRIPVSTSGDEFDRLRTTLNQMLDKITDLLANVHQVSTDIAHDLRTPLARLRHRLEKAQATATSGESVRATLQMTTRELDGILETFAALLRIAQLESGSQRSAFRPVALSRLLGELADAYEVVAEEGGRTLVWSIRPDIRIVGDAELLTQLFSNLIENALTHTFPGSRVSIELTWSKDGACATVRDDGPGIESADRPFVFRRFYRAERSRSTPGSGLGLSLVAAIANLHGANVALEDNRPGVCAAILFHAAGLEPDAGKVSSGWPAEQAGLAQPAMAPG